MEAIEQQGNLSLIAIEKKIEWHLDKIDEHEFAIGLDLIIVRDNFLYKQSGYVTWGSYTQERWKWTTERARQLIEGSKVFQNIVQSTTIPTKVAPENERQVRPLTQLPAEQQAPAWQEAVAQSRNGKPTSREVERVVQEFKQEIAFQPTKPKKASYITLEQWQTFSDQSKKDIIQAAQHETEATFNQTNDNIEWARWSWNPITGCLHNCAYCYARDIANRFYEQGFAPSFIPSRLTAPANTKFPDLNKISDPVERMGKRNVFVCSMADLFGKWVPVEWIEAVLAQIRNNPQWTFLLLTKFPVRMAEFTYPVNVWLGTSVDYQWAVERAEKAFTKIKASGFGGVCWLSCEPMMERLTFNNLNMFDWVVYGGSSASTQTPEYRPPFDDIAHLYNQARVAGCKVYQKTNLIPGMSDTQRIREYPG